MASDKNIASQAKLARLFIEVRLADWVSELCEDACPERIAALSDGTVAKHDEYCRWSSSSRDRD